MPLPCSLQRSLEGAAPLAPSFDTAGWFARDAELLVAVGTALLGGGGAADAPPGGWSLLVPEVRALACAGTWACTARARTFILKSQGLRLCHQAPLHLQAPAALHNR